MFLFYKKTKQFMVMCHAIFWVYNTEIQANEHQPLTLENAVNLAILRDVWGLGNKHKQDSLEAQSISSGTLPDPKISMGVANIAADSFEFGQEPMTHLKLGISQMFPRGNSRALKKQKLLDLAAGFPHQRENRSMRLTLIVANLWLDAFKAQKSIALIHKDRGLFEQLVEVAEASYTSALGKTRQYDIIRSQLELTRLDDRLAVLKQNKEAALEKLKEWINNDFISDKVVDVDRYQDLSIQIPDFQLDLKHTEQISTKALNHFVDHPIVKVINQKMIASETNIKLVEQKYKPAFGVNTSYGYRENNQFGETRSDLFSVGVTFDVPLFTKNKQDQDVKSAILESQSIESEKWMLLRNMKATLEKNVVDLKMINQRIELYENQLLPQMHEQAEASLTAYTNDDGDFAEVVRSRIAVLNAEIEALEINVDKQKTIIQIKYFLNSSHNDMIKTNKGELR